MSTINCQYGAACARVTAISRQTKRRQKSGLAEERGVGSATVGDNKGSVEH